MQRIQEPEVIKQLIIRKQALEVELAFDLLEIFNDEKVGLIESLRAMARSAIFEMNIIRKDNRFAFDTKWKQKKGGWKDYAGIQYAGKMGKKAGKINTLRWGRWDYYRLMRGTEHLRAEHCADIIRIYGEVVEDVLKGKEHEIKERYKKGGAYHWKKYDSRKQGSQPDAGRRRKPSKPIDYWAYAAQQTPAWQFMYFNPGSGINRWCIEEGDTLGKMDQVFGLMPGATISGTTTDNIYFIDKFVKIGFDPIFFLLPAATIVSAGHHSLLEVAIPLALNGLNDYVVGLYSTLLPKGAGEKQGQGGVRQGAAEIESLLSQYERHPENDLILVAYDGRRPVDCCVYSNYNEIAEWKNFATANDSLMALFKTMPPWPTKDMILKHAEFLGFDLDWPEDG